MQFIFVHEWTIMSLLMYIIPESVNLLDNTCCVLEDLTLQRQQFLVIMLVPLFQHKSPLLVMRKHFFKIFLNFWSVYFRISRKSWTSVSLVLHTCWCNKIKFKKYSLNIGSCVTWIFNCMETYHIQRVNKKFQVKYT